MEKVDERVLAYKLAKEINLKDLAEVSGGNANATVQKTGGPTGTEKSLDGQIDTTVDW